MSKVQVQTYVNGEQMDFLCDPQQSLLDVLRDDLGRTAALEFHCPVAVEGGDIEHAHAVETFGKMAFIDDIRVIESEAAAILVRVSPIAMRIRLEKLGLLHRMVPLQRLLSGR